MVGSDAAPYILLPKQGIHGAIDRIEDLLPDTRHYYRVRSIESPRRLEMNIQGMRERFELPISFGEPEPQPVLVLDTMQRTDDERPPGPRLVVMNQLTAAILNSPASPYRAVDVVEYDLPGLNLQSATAMGPGAAPGPTTTIRVTCQDAANGNVLENATVVAQTTLGNVSGLTNASGYVDLAIPTNSNLSRLAVNPPPPGYWGTYVNNPASFTLLLNEVDLTRDDSVRHYFDSAKFLAAQFDPTSGVRVGIIDTGVYDHADLNVVYARNAVTGEPANATADLTGHGTHVAGLTGGNGILKGMAPNVPLYSYRVFKQASLKATNFAVLKAIIFAEEDKVDVLNISLGDGADNETVKEAIEDARLHGMLVTAAAGNGSAAGVYYPGGYPGALPVTAVGRRKTYPGASVEELDELSSPTTSDAGEYMARFSNYGVSSLVAAPGVGAVSTLPNDKYGPMSGTSMAAPVIAGIAAGLLSQNPATFAMNRESSQRADAIRDLVVNVCAPLGFSDPTRPGLAFDGMGMPSSAKL